jgi:hypothetical protein
VTRVLGKLFSLFAGLPHDSFDFEHLA